MDDVALANYIAGTFAGPVDAGSLGHFCADLIGVPAGTRVLLSGYTLEKLRYVHGDINFSHYRHIPAILLQGFVAVGRTPNVLELWWVGMIDGEKVPLWAILKATKNGEVYVQTFHRISVKEARRRLKLARKSNGLRREQVNGAALLAGGTDHLKNKKGMA